MNFFKKLKENKPLYKEVKSLLNFEVIEEKKLDNKLSFSIDEKLLQKTALFYFNYKIYTSFKDKNLPFRLKDEIKQLILLITTLIKNKNSLSGQLLEFFKLFKKNNIDLNDTKLKLAKVLENIERKSSFSTNKVYKIAKLLLFGDSENIEFLKEFLNPNPKNLPLFEKNFFLLKNFLDNYSKSLKLSSFVLFPNITLMEKNIILFLNIVINSSVYLFNFTNDQVKLEDQVVDFFITLFLDSKNSKSLNFSTITYFDFFKKKLYKISIDLSKNLNLKEKINNFFTFL